MIDRFEATIPSLSDEVRNISIYVPDNLETDQRVPVFYMFDGQNVFFDEEATYGTSWGLGTYLPDNDIKMIVVGIDSSRNPDNTRLCEYSPYTFDDETFGHVLGKGKKTLNWIIEELKPYIDDNYPALTDRKHTFVGGSSMGGLLSYYCLLAHNNIFSKAACLSPSLWANNEKLVAYTVKSRVRKDSTFYLDYGTLEAKGKHGQNSLRGFWNCVNVLKEKDINIVLKVNQGKSHCEQAWAQQIPSIIELFMED